jgi:uncharacterized protein
MADRIRVSVIYADPDIEIERFVELQSGSNVEAAIRESGINDSLPRDFSPTAIGIYGTIVDSAHVLRDGDRIELYRPLKIDPKEARRRRAIVKRLPKLKTDR